MRKSYIKLVLAALAAAVAVAIWGNPEITPRPYIDLVALLLLGGLLWSAGNAVIVIHHQSARIAWKTALRTVSRVGLAISAGFIFLLVVSNTPEFSSVPWARKARIVELIVPLAMAVQAALAFSPDDEPGLEILLACPRPIAWVLLERFAALFLAQAGIALAGIALTTQFINDVDLPLLLIRWLPSALLLSGIAVYVTQRTRVAAFGVITAGLIWIAGVFYGNALLPGIPSLRPFSYIQPLLWLIHPYLEPGILTTGDYWLNRFCVTALGINLFALAILMLRDEEYLLLNLRQPTNHQ